MQTENFGVTRMIHITDYACFHEKIFTRPVTMAFRFTILNNMEKLVWQFAMIGIIPNICALAINGAEIVFIPCRCCRGMA